MILLRLNIQKQLNLYQLHNKVNIIITIRVIIK